MSPEKIETLRRWAEGIWYILGAVSGVAFMILLIELLWFFPQLVAKHIGQ